MQWSSGPLATGCRPWWLEEQVEVESGNPVTLRLSAASFFQTNSRMTGHLYRRAAEAAGLTFKDVPNWIQAAGYTPGRWSGSQHVALSQLA